MVNMTYVAAQWCKIIQGGCIILLLLSPHYFHHQQDINNDDGVINGGMPRRRGGVVAISLDNYDNGGGVEGGCMVVEINKRDDENS